MLNKESIVLGSGKLYMVEFTGELPELSAVETEENRMGYVKGGASVEYKPTFYEAKDDLGYVAKQILTEEEVLLKSGIMTWNGERLAKLCSTARVEDDEESNTRTVKFGGVQNFNGKQYVILFVHEDEVDGDVRLMIVGNNQSGFTLTFAKDAETVIDAEFKALPSDESGTLIHLIEQMPQTPSA